MSENQSAPEGQTPPSSENDGNQEPKNVSYESHRKLLDEKKKVEQRLKEIEDAKKVEQEAKLIEEGKLKEALELKEKELLEERHKRQSYEEQHKEAKKLSAVIRGLGSDVNEKWYGVISQNTDAILVNEDGSIDSKSVTQVVDNLKKQWPEMIEKKAQGMPNGTPQGVPNKITRSEWLKLSSAEMKKWKHDQII